MVTKLKKSINTIFIGLIALTALPVMATQDTPTPGNGDAILTKQEEDPFRKRMPSKMNLHLVYENERVSIFSTYYENEFSLRFENYETGATYEIPSIQIGESAPLALEIGEYQLTAVAEDGTELIGFMQIY